jgi:hypothetical protein
MGFILDLIIAEEDFKMTTAFVRNDFGTLQ